MDQWFDSAGGLRSLLAGIGYGMEITQLSPGPLRGRFQLGGSPLVPLLSITTNQVLVFEGDRRACWLPFCINTQGEMPLVRGNAVPHHSLHGFCSELRDAFFSCNRARICRSPSCPTHGSNSWPWPAAKTGLWS